MEKEGNPLCEKDDSGSYVHLDIIPQTFILPGNYSIFQDEFKKDPNQVWICKPVNSAQGKGIFLVDKIQKLKKFATSSKLPF